MLCSTAVVLEAQRLKLVRGQPLGERPGAADARAGVGSCDVSILPMQMPMADELSQRSLGNDRRSPSMATAAAESVRYISREYPDEYPGEYPGVPRIVWSWKMKLLLFLDVWSTLVAR